MPKQKVTTITFLVMVEIKEGQAFWDFRFNRKIRKIMLNAERDREVGPSKSGVLRDSM